MKTVWQSAFTIIALLAARQELRKPPDKRTWHGKVADFVDYDFCPPTVERVQNTHWNAKHPILSSKVFGVGSAPNLRAVVKLFSE